MRKRALFLAVVLLGSTGLIFQNQPEGLADFYVSKTTTKSETYLPCKKPSREIGKWKLIYEVKITKGSNKAQVTISLDDPNDKIKQIYLRTRPYGPYQVAKNHITNLRSNGGEVNANTWEVKGVRKAKLLYTVNLNLKYRRGGYSGFAHSDWVVTAGDFLFITNGWSGTPKYPHVIVKLDIPSEWEAYTPYRQNGLGSYDATGMIGHITPRDFIVAGNPKIFKVATQERVGTKFIVVVIEPSAASAHELVEFITKVGTEYTKIAACTPPCILGIVVPEPMRRHGGEGKDISIQVSDDNPFPFDLSWGSSTFTHELFHLYQRYHKDKDEVWIKEGIATYYQFYGPLKTGYMTTEDFWNVMVKVQAGRADKDAVLLQGEDPYFKRSLVILALDVKIRQDTDGKRSFDDVFETLNSDFAGKYVSSPVLELIISSLTGNDYSDFFEEYVRGTGYPEQVFAASRDSYVSFLTEKTRASPSVKTRRFSERS